MPATKRDQTGAVSPLVGAELIAAERRRQVEVEGWTAKHDRGHALGELGRAAISYVSFAIHDPVYVKRDVLDGVLFKDPWPWPNTAERGIDDGDKRKLIEPHGPANYVLWEARLTRQQRVDFLVKAGALIAAEIDRLRERQGRSEA